MSIEYRDESLDLKKNPIVSQFQGFLSRDEWDEAAQLIDQARLEGSLDSLDIGQQLLVELDDKGKKLEQQFADKENYELDFYLEKAGQPIQLITQKLVTQMSKSEPGLGYLSSTVGGRDSVPRAYMMVADLHGDRAETEDLNQFSYYYLVAEALSKNGSPQSVALLEQLLKQINTDIEQETERQEQRRVELKKIGKAVELYDESVSSEQQEFDQAEFNAFANKDMYYGWTVKPKILQALAETGNPEATPVAIEFIRQERSDAPLYTEDVLRLLESIDPRAAADQLLQLARSNDAIEKRIALSLLYRLESGKINLSEEGLNYLGKVYDLGDLNNPQNYAQRITGQGDVGIFKADSATLLRYFRLSGLDSQQVSIRPELLELTYKTFLFGDKKETVEDKQQRERFLREFQDNYFSYFDQELFGKDSAVKFRDLSFAEQAHVVELLDRQGAEEAKDLLPRLAEQYGLNGVKTALSLEDEQVVALMTKGVDYGSQSERATNSLELLFSRYAFVVGITESVDNYLRDNFPEQVADHPDLAVEVKRNILHRASLVLQTSLAKLTQDNIERCIKRLDHVQAEALLLAQTIRAFLEQAQNLESIRGLEVEELSGPQLSAEDAEAMLQIYRDNWQLKTTPEYWQHLESSLLSDIKNPGSRFKILRHEGKIVSFALFVEEVDEQDQRYIHSKAFSTDLSFQAAKIGEVFFGQAVKQETARQLPIRGETSPDNPMLKKYLEMGYVETGRTVIYGDPKVLIELPAKRS